MKKVFLLFLLPCFLFCLAFYASSSVTKYDKANILHHNAGAIINNKNVAVLELFTSQGCSSCPPAERLLGDYSSKENVIILSFHVDYWDRYGWKDPFSSKAYTQRQYDYASALHSNVYTPQLVVNGVTEMIGSDAGKVENAVNKIAGEDADALVEIKKTEEKNGKVVVNFSTSGNTANDVVNIALAEKKEDTKINAGENGGATITGYNVVVNFKNFRAGNNGDAMNEIDIPSSVNDHKNLSVIVFLQNKKTHKISGAAEASL